MSEHPGTIRHQQERKIPEKTQGFFKPFIGSPTFTQWDSVGPLVIRVYMGVVQNYGTRKLPLRRAFGNLSRPSRIGTWDYDQVFVCNFHHRDLQEDCILTFFWTFDFWTLVLHPLFEKLLKLRHCRKN